MMEWVPDRVRREREEEFNATRQRIYEHLTTAGCHFSIGDGGAIDVRLTAETLVGIWRIAHVAALISQEGAKQNAASEEVGRELLQRAEALLGGRPELAAKAGGTSDESQAEEAGS